MAMDGEKSLPIPTTNIGSIDLPYLENATNENEEEFTVTPSKNLT